MTTASANLPSSLTNWYASNVINQNSPSSGGLLSETPVQGTTSIPGATADNSAKTPAITQAGALNGTTSGNTYTPSTYTAAQLGDPKSWDVTANQTVAGQLNADLNSNSPLMQQAKTQGLITANARGLLNSSIASQASEGAMIASATPIATADAATNANAASYNANQSNAFATTNVNAQNTAAGANANASNVSNNANSSNVQQTDITNLNNTATMNQQQVTQAANLSQDFNNNIQAIQNNQYMSQAAKDYNISQQYQSYKAQITMLNDVGSVPNIGELLSNPAPDATKPDPGATFGPPPTPPAPAAGGGGGSVICTYYHSIGFMSDETYAIDDKYLKQLFAKDPELVAWYWSWGVKFADTLKNNPALSYTAWPVISAWTRYMEKQVDQSKSGSIIGHGIHILGLTAFRVMKQFKFYGMCEIC